MGSFYATCSITRQTITNGQPMYMQFMLPAYAYKKDVSIGTIFVDSFLKIAKEKGIEKAIETFTESTSTWKANDELSEKGLAVSNDGPYVNWVPFGPAIRGIYDDYGNIAPDNDEDSVKRVEILEKLIGLPFYTIMDVATDDRWYTYGLHKYADNDNPNENWRPEGIEKDMPEWQLLLCKQLSVTYLHGAVYDELANPNFSSDEKNGIIKSKYAIQCKKKYLDPIKNKFSKTLKDFLKYDIDPIGIEEDAFEYRINLRELLTNIGIFRNCNEESKMVYLACIAREEKEIGLDWFFETLNFMYSLSCMCISLERSEYGSQHSNFYGWQRIYNALSPKIEEEIKQWEEDEEEDEN